MNQSKEAYQQEKQFLLPTYGKFPFALVRGEGCYVWDDSGNRYLDFYGGHAVSLLGHSHPAWVAALKRQLDELDFYSNVCFHPKRAEAAELLVEHSYTSMRTVFFCNSGAEANETALKLARKHTARSTVVAMQGGFHGRTIASLSVTWSPRLRNMFQENLVGCTHFVELGDLDAVQRLPPDDVAAVLLEPVQSMRGVYMAEPDYYRGLRDYCTAHGIQLIFDEVQTGTGRTGKWFAGAHWDVEPDLVTTAKGVGGGFPVGVVLASGEISEAVKVGDHGSTFGGGPLAAAAVAATYRTIIKEELLAKVARLGAEAIERLRGMIGRGVVRDVRGLGYLIGVECEQPASELHKHLVQRRILVGKADEPNTLRLLPPLTATAAEWSAFFDAFEAFAA